MNVEVILNWTKCCGEAKRKNKMFALVQLDSIGEREVRVVFCKKHWNKLIKDMTKVKEE